MRVYHALVSVVHALDELQVLMWYGCNLARFSLAWTGWLLVCRRRWRASLLSDQSQIELKGTYVIEGVGRTAVLHPPPIPRWTVSEGCSAGSFSAQGRSFGFGYVTTFRLTSTSKNRGRLKGNVSNRPGGGGRIAGWSGMSIVLALTRHP